MRAADLAAGAAAAVLAALGGGCSGGDDGGPATAPTVRYDAPPTADGTPPENGGLPLTGISGTLTDLVLTQEAAYEITADCMAEQGFDMPPFDAPAVVHPPERPFGPWTTDDVADGYGLPTTTDIPHDDPTFEQFIGTMTSPEQQAWSTAYIGSPTSGTHPTVTLPDGREKESGFTTGYEQGCSFEGFDTVFGGYDAREALRTEIEAMTNDAIEDAEGGDLVDQALDVWHDCMEAHGFDVEGGADGPRELRHHFYEEPGVSEAERAAAAQDVACKADANLHDAWFVAKAEAEQHQIDDHQLYVEAYRELVDETHDRARRIVADHGG